MAYVKKRTPITNRNSGTASSTAYTKTATNKTTGQKTVSSGTLKKVTGTKTATPLTKMGGTGRTVTAGAGLAKRNVKRYD